MIYWISLFLGCGILLSYNFIVSAPDYFADLYPDYNVNFLIVPAYTIPDILFLFVCLFYGHLLSFTTRIVVCFVWMGLFLLFPFITTFIFPSQQIGFFIILGVSAAAGITTATLQTAIMGFCNYLPVSYIQVNIAGQAMVGVIAGVTRLVINLIQQYTPMSTQTNGLIYFGIGGAFDLFCAASFLYATRSDFVRFHLREYFASQESQGTAEKSSSSDMKQNAHKNTVVIKMGKQKKFRPNRHSFDESECDGVEITKSCSINHIGYIQVKDEETELVTKVTVFGVFNKIKFLALAMFLTFFATFLPFPAMIVSLESEYKWVNDGNWMPVILVVE